MNVEQNYLSLLRQALWQTGPELPVLSGEELDELLALADCQKTRGLIYDALMNSGTELPRPTARQMQRLLLNFSALHGKLDKALVRVVTVLRDAGIPAVLLKGQGVARYYPVPKLRECGDIDLYIGPDRLEDAVRTLTPIVDRMEDHLNGKHWECWIGEAEIELHQHSMILPSRSLTRFYRTLEAEGFSRNLVVQDFDGVRVDTPEDTFNAFYLFFHAWHHFIVGGVGFRQLCDWVLLLHGRAAQIDRDRLERMIVGMKLLRAWQIFGCIAVHELALPQEELPCYDARRFKISRKVLALILEEGNFARGFKPRRPRPKAYLAGKAHSFGLHVRRFFKTLRIDPAQTFRTFWSTLFVGIAQIFRDLLSKSRHSRR
ncbi:MAG: nucleotidyltransferase family protein [Bacteroidales bacterium]|nr:nucleotidyltransferase family protein [Bacteroidales bacterium]